VFVIPEYHSCGEFVALQMGIPRLETDSVHAGVRLSPSWFSAAVLDGLPDSAGGRIRANSIGDIGSGVFGVFYAEPRRF